MRDLGRLEHIITAVENIEDFTVDMTFAQFKADKRTYFAVVKNIEIIGEAVYKLTNEFKDSEPELPWTLLWKKCGKFLYTIIITFRQRLYGMW